MGLTGAVPTATTFGYGVLLIGEEVQTDPEQLTALLEAVADGGFGVVPETEGVALLVAGDVLAARLRLDDARRRHFDDRDDLVLSPLDFDDVVRPVVPERLVHPFDVGLQRGVGDRFAVRAGTGFQLRRFEGLLDDFDVHGSFLSWSFEQVEAARGGLHQLHAPMDVDAARRGRDAQPGRDVVVVEVVEVAEPDGGPADG